MDAEQAHRLAEGHLSAALPRRWRHVQGVARRAAALGPLIGDQTSDLVCAAWLHDIGYAPPLAASGFHPLDGARYLTAIGMPRRLVCLVAHHSCAVLEAGLRGLAAELAAFDDESGAVRDALWCCDITTSPYGEPVTAEQRISEIKERYGPDHLVTRFITQAAPELLAAVERTEHRMAVDADGRELVAQDQDLCDPPRLLPPGQPQPRGRPGDQEEDEPQAHDRSLYSGLLTPFMTTSRPGVMWP